MSDCEIGMQHLHRRMWMHTLLYWIIQTVDLFLPICQNCVYGHDLLHLGANLQTSLEFGQIKYKPLFKSPALSLLVFTSWDTVGKKVVKVCTKVASNCYPFVKMDMKQLIAWIFWAILLVLMFLASVEARRVRTSSIIVVNNVNGGCWCRILVNFLSFNELVRHLMFSRYCSMWYIHVHCKLHRSFLMLHNKWVDQECSCEFIFIAFCVSVIAINARIKKMRTMKIGSFKK